MGQYVYGNPLHIPNRFAPKEVTDLDIRAQRPDSFIEVSREQIDWIFPIWEAGLNLATEVPCASDKYGKKIAILEKGFVPIYGRWQTPLLSLEYNNDEVDLLHSDGELKTTVLQPNPLVDDVLMLFSNHNHARGVKRKKC